MFPVWCQIQRPHKCNIHLTSYSFYQKRRKPLSNVSNQCGRKKKKKKRQIRIIMIIYHCFMFFSSERNLSGFVLSLVLPLCILLFSSRFFSLGLIIFQFLQQFGNSSPNHSFLQISPSVLPFNSLVSTTHFIPQENRNKMLLVCVFTANLL